MTKDKENKFVKLNANKLDIGKKPYFEERENKYEVKEHIWHIKANGSDRFETIYKNKAGEKINMEVSVTYLNLEVL